VQHILEIKNLHLNFKIFEGIAKVLDGINLTIAEKETVALVGESGCGKSSIAHAVLGILPPSKNSRRENTLQRERYTYDE